VKRLPLGAIVLGVALAVMAVATNDRRLTWVAIGVLACALVLRLAARRRREREGEDHTAST
jgi:Flp pilus assembly protein TadB